jgi:hypothetical protein
MQNHKLAAATTAAVVQRAARNPVPVPAGLTRPVSGHFCLIDIIPD